MNRNISYLHKNLCVCMCKIEMFLNNPDSMLHISLSHPLPVHMILDVICYFRICGRIIKGKQGKQRTKVHTLMKSGS